MHDGLAKQDCMQAHDHRALGALASVRIHITVPNKRVIREEISEMIIAKVYGSNRDAQVDELFQLTRPHAPPSGQWLLMGAVRTDNFGQEMERVKFVCDCCHRPYPDALKQLERIQDDWTWKNGSQKWYAIDYDHGSQRVWRMPEGYSIRRT